MGILEILTIIFVVMKCLGHFDHSWWVVFSPMLAAAAVYVVMWACILKTAATATKDWL